MASQAHSLYLYSNDGQTFIQADCDSCPGWNINLNLGMYPSADEITVLQERHRAESTKEA